MKIAISAENDNVDSLIDQRFGRCKYFLIVEIIDKNIGEVNAVENEGAVQGHGAGIKAAQQVGDLGVDTIITGSIGPNATDVLHELGIKRYHASGTAKDALEKLMDDRLEEITEIAEAHSTSGESPEGQDKESAGERIFLPLLEDKGMDSAISDHFGHAPFFGLYDTKTGKLDITKNDLSHTDPNMSPVDQIIEAVNPTTVFALGIGGRAIRLFNEKGICLKTGDYRTVKDVIDNLDRLEEQTASCGHGKH